MKTLLALLILCGCTAPPNTPLTSSAPIPPKSVPKLPTHRAMLVTDSLPNVLQIGYRATDGQLLSDTGVSVTYEGPVPDVSLCLSPDSISLMERKNGDHWVVVVTMPWSQADSMPDGFFGFITNSVQAAISTAPK